MAISTIGTGGDYTTIAAWAAASGSGDVAELLNQVFNESVTLSGSSNRIIRPASGAEHDGTEGSGARIVWSGAGTAGGAVVTLGESGSQLIGVEVAHTGAVPTGSGTPFAGVNFSANNTKVIRCIVRDIRGGSLASRGLLMGNHSGCVAARNIIYDITAAGGNARGINQFSNTGTTTIVGNTVYNCTQRGYNLEAGSGGTLEAHGNIGCGNGVADFVWAGAGTLNSSYNMSSDATADRTGSDTGAIESVTTSAQFVSTTGGSEDLHLVSGSDAVDAGIDLSSYDAAWSQDIDGVTVSSPYDIGADQYVAAASPVLDLPVASLTLSAGGSLGVVGGGVAGTATATLPALTASGAGAVQVAGTGAASLPAISASSAGTVEVSGAATASLPALTATGTGAVDVTGSGAVTLPMLTVTASGPSAGAISGTGAVGLPALTASAAGAVAVAGIVGATLPALSAAGTATVRVQGGGSLTLPMFLAAGVAVLDITGAAAATLPMLTVLAYDNPAEPLETLELTLVFCRGLSLSAQVQQTITADLEI